MSENFITGEIKALIGMSSEPIAAKEPVNSSEIRRFHHATMDNAPRYYDAEWAAGSRYGGVVAPPAFPFHAFRRGAADPDPLDSMGDPDFDGINRKLRPGLPAVEVPLKALLNAGYEYEFYRYAKPGELVRVTSTYRDIYQREGRAGPMVFVLIEDLYETDTGEALVRVTNTSIFR